MEWFRDISKAFGWAVGAAGIAVALPYTGLFSGLAPVIAPLVIAPVVAYQYHRSARIAWLVAAWLAVLVAVAASLIAWAFRDFHFRAIQG